MEYFFYYYVKSVVGCQLVMWLYLGVDVWFQYNSPTEATMELEYALDLVTIYFMFNFLQLIIDRFIDMQNIWM